MKYKKYTPEEEILIAEEIANSPTNIKQGLETAAKRLGRTYYAVAYHWYNVQSKKNKKAIFLIASEKETIVNRKNNNENFKIESSKDSITHNIFKKILKLFNL